MNTLIELFDERPIENVLATEVFRPSKVFFLINDTDDQIRELKKLYTSYYARKGINTEVNFVRADMFDAYDVLARLEEIINNNPDCALDITGGTDDSLFASGLLLSKVNIPVFTYSRRKNMFFNITNASFADYYPNPLNYSIEDFLLIAGGMMYTGRVENEILKDYMYLIDPFFNVFMKYRRSWVKIITYIQYISQQDDKYNLSLKAEGPFAMKKHGVTARANIDALEAFESLGMIHNLTVKTDKVSFVFRDQQCRKWLRDVGSVLELYVYKACLDTGVFHDVRTSVIVNWEKTGDVSNEIDVMASKGITPFFISCKTGEVKTEAVNELAVLRDRFGGAMAKSAIVTATRTPAALRHRAMEMNMNVIDYDLLAGGNIKDLLVSLAG